MLSCCLNSNIFPQILPSANMYKPKKTLLQALIARWILDSEILSANNCTLLGESCWLGHNVSSKFWQRKLLLLMLEKFDKGVDVKRYTTKLQPKAKRHPGIEWTCLQQCPWWLGISSSWLLGVHTHLPWVVLAISQPCPCLPGSWNAFLRTWCHGIKSLSNADY